MCSCIAKRLVGERGIGFTRTDVDGSEGGEIPIPSPDVTVK